MTVRTIRKGCKHPVGYGALGQGHRQDGNLTPSCGACGFVGRPARAQSEEGRPQPKTAPPSPAETLFQLALSAHDIPSVQLDAALRDARQEALQQLADTADIATSVQLTEQLQQQRELRQQLRMLRAAPVQNLTALSSVRFQLQEAKENISLLMQLADRTVPVSELIDARGLHARPDIDRIASAQPDAQQSDRVDATGRRTDRARQERESQERASQARERRERARREREGREREERRDRRGVG